MKLTPIKEGPYKGQYEDEIGVIYNEEQAKLKFPEDFKPVKKAAKKKAVKSTRTK